MRFGRLILAASVLWPSAAFAKELDYSKDRHQSRLLVNNYAQCVVRAHHDEVKAVLLGDSSNDDMQRHYHTVFDSSCLTPVSGNIRVTFYLDMYRYLLADALVRADFMQSGPKSFADRLPLAHLPIPAEANVDRAVSQAKFAREKKNIQQYYNGNSLIGALSRYGECVARADPVAARLWILADPDGSVELDRVKVLMPAFQQCVENGKTLKFSTEQLRGTVALNYYRLANATQQPSLGALH